HVDPDRADRYALAGQPRESLVGEVRVGEALQQVARLRTGDHEDAAGRRHRAEGDAAVAGQELPEHVMIVSLQRPGGDEIELARRPLVDCELGTHAAAMGEQVAERYAPLLLRNAVGENRIEPVARARPADQSLGEGRHVLDADILVDVPAFLADEGEIIGAAEAPLLADRLPRTRLGMV